MLALDIFGATNLEVNFKICKVVQIIYIHMQKLNQLARKVNMLVDVFKEKEKSYL